MSRMAKAAIIIMAMTLISKGLGFFREIALASKLGASSYTDAYLIATTIPTVIFASIGGALGTTFIPIYSEIRQKEGEKRALEFTNNILNIMLLLTIIFTLIGIYFSREIVKIFATGFKGELLDITVKFAIILFPSIIFIAMNYIMTVYLQSNESFAPPVLSGIPYNLIILTSIFLISKQNIDILIYGTLVAISSQFLFQIPFAYRYGYRYNLTLNFKDKYIRKVLYLVMPVFIGLSANQINVLVDRTLASNLVEGSISALNFANKLNLFVMGLFISSIATVVYPMFSKLSVANDNLELKKTITRCINIIIMLILPIVVISMIFATPIVRILFERGSFTERDTLMTSTALFYFSIGIIGVALREILSRAFYAIQDTRTPMINGIMTVILNIVLNLILIRYMAHGGLALSTSISAVFASYVLYIGLKNKIGEFEERNIIIVGIKGLIASFIMGIIIKALYIWISRFFGATFIVEVINLGISSSIGILIYIILIYIFKIEEMNVVVKMFKNKLRRT